MSLRKACFCCRRYLRKLPGLGGGRACPVCDPRIGSGCDRCGNQWGNLWKPEAAHDQAATRRVEQAPLPHRYQREIEREFELAMDRTWRDDQ